MAEANQQFDTFDQWVSMASSWLTRHPRYCQGDKSEGQMHWQRFVAICFDVDGKIVTNGGDFQRARDFDKFPIRWIWPDQVPPILLGVINGRIPLTPHKPEGKKR
jgi:hypothetical protein